jgi:hypothetical protein
MLLNRIGALLVAACLAVGHVTPAWPADPLSPATKRLFDAVWADDMARVKASIVDGANLEAINDDGVRAVELAVDKGHYDIAHYLLSVERLRSDDNTATRPPAQPDPRSQSVPAPVPATAPVVGVAPAPIGPAGASIPARPSVRALPSQPAANAPAPQPEAMWTAPTDGKETTQPGLRILGTAPPQPVRPVPQAAPEAAPQVPANGPQSQLQGDDAPEQPGLLDKVTDFFNFSKDAAEAQSAPAAAKPPPASTVEPAVSPTAATEPVATPEPVPEPIPEPAPRSVRPAAEAAPAETAAIPTPPPAPPAPSAPPTSTSQPTTSPALVDTPEPASAEGPTLLDRISNFLKPDASSEQALDSPVPTPVAAPEPTPEPVPVPAKKTASASEPVLEPASEPVPEPAPAPARTVSTRPVTDEIANAPSAETPAAPADPGGGLWGRISDLFTPDEAGKPAAESPQPSPPAAAVETAPADPPPPASESTAALAPEAEPAAASERGSGGFFDSLTSWLKRDEPLTETASDGPALAEPVIEIRPAQAPAPAQASVPPVAQPMADPSRPATPGALRIVRAPEKPKPVPRPAAPPVAEPAPATAAAPAEVAAVSPSVDATAPRRVRQPLGGPPVRDPASIDEPLIATAALKDVSFEFGTGIQLGMNPPDAAVGGKTCVDKARWNTMFCIEDMTWPKSVAESFRAESSVYRGEKAIIQYENGRSVQMHVLFPAKALWTVSEHFKKLYGPPTEMPEVWTAMIGEPKRPNRVLRWHSRNAKTGAETVLEIREIDDLRWSAPPDTKHGVVRVLEKGRGSVFQLLSSTDLLLVGLRGGRQ